MGDAKHIDGDYMIREMFGCCALPAGFDFNPLSLVKDKAKLRPFQFLLGILKINNLLCKHQI